MFFIANNRSIGGTIWRVASMLINIFALLGIIIDPTTEGTDDSELAMGYDEPSKKTSNKNSHNRENNIINKGRD